MLQRAMSNKKIRIMTNKTIHSWKGSNNILEGVELIDTYTGNLEEVY